MQEVQGIIDQKYYEFKYFEKHKQIVIWVGDINGNGPITNFKQKYLINVIRKPRSIHLNCNCPSGRYRHYCKHADFALEEFDFNNVTKPKTWIKQIAESYYENWLTIKESLRKGESV